MTQEYQAGSPHSRPHVHINALDGIRGLAFLLVLVYHATAICKLATHNIGELLYYYMTGFGLCGVDLFFVLSGFLITGILLEARNNQFYFRDFYMRRVLRIFPLFYLALFLFYFGLKPLFSWQVSFDWLDSHQIWFWVYVQNWLYALKSFPGPNFLSHFWSLAIEEQFYLFWPLVVFSCSDKWVLRISLFLFGLSLFIRIVASVEMPFQQAAPFCYFGTVSRFDGLATGAVLAVIFRRDEWIQRLGGLCRKYFWVFAGATAITYGTQQLWHTTVYITVLAPTFLALTFGAILVIAITHPPDHRVVRFFSNRQMRYVGQISYGLYVFHFPVMILMAGWWQGLHLWAFRLPLVRQLGFVLASGAVTLLGATLSWYGFESRILGLKKHFVSRPTVPS